MQSETTMLETSKVPGTSVYSGAQEEIGAVDDLIVDTVSGKVRYAILSFGGFLGLGKSQYVIPWTALKWDPSLHGYVTGVTEDQLKMSPDSTHFHCAIAIPSSVSTRLTEHRTTGSSRHGKSVADAGSKMKTPAKHSLLAGVYSIGRLQRILKC